VRIIRLFLTARREVPRILPLMRDATVPLWLKAVTVVAALLVVSPLNFFNAIPLFGFFDDAVLLGLIATWFVRSADRSRMAT